TIRRPSRLPSTLFPYTTLFRSGHRHGQRCCRGAEIIGGDCDERVRADCQTHREVKRTGGHIAQGGVSIEELDVGDAAIIIGGYRDRKSTRLNSSHVKISYAVFC